MMSDKTVLAAALKLSLEARKKVAQKLIESIEDQELQKTILAGGKIAEGRLKNLRLGKSRKISEEEVEKLLLRRLKK